MRADVRTRIGVVAALAMALLAAPSAPSAVAQPLSQTAAVPQAATSKRPNIVLILIDDLSATSTGPYGAKFETPNLDRLAAEGMRFTHAYSSPLCNPSRVELMTGMHNGRNYITGQMMERSQVTFGDVLKDAGYVTAVTGKWKLAGPGRPLNSPQYFGFDYSINSELHAPNPRFSRPELTQDGKRLSLPDNAYGPDVVNAYALNFIEKNKDRPFFLYYPMILIHDPHEPPSDSPDFLKRPANDKYVPDMIRYMDKLIGNVVRKLEVEGLRETTMILVIADNGTKQRIVTPMKDGSTLPGGKGTTGILGTRIPMIAAQPGRVPAGTVNDELIDFTDFMPTLAELAGTTVPQTLPQDGWSFLPELLGSQRQTREWIFDWFRNTPDLPLLEYAFDQRFKLYRDGRYYDTQADMMEVKPLSLGSLKGEAAAAYTKLKGVLDANRPVPVATVEVIKRPSAPLKIGERFELVARAMPLNAMQRTLRWESSDPKVVEVNRWGRLTAIGPGTAKVTINSFDQKQSLTISVSIGG